MKSKALLLALGLAGLLAGPAFGQDKRGKPVPPTMTWTGVVRDDETLQKQAPDAGYVGDSKTWTKLWQAWRGKEPIPKVDFGKEIVLVGTAAGPNKVGLSAALDDEGDLKVTARSTLIGGKGFGYTLMGVKREGIKTFRGKPLAPPG